MQKNAENLYNRYFVQVPKKLVEKISEIYAQE